MRDADIIKELETLNVNNRDCLNLLAGPNEVEVTNESKTLEELGITLHDDLRCLTLIPVDVGIFWASGAAMAGANLFPSSGAAISIIKATASTLEFIVSSGTIKMQVVQEGGGNVG